MAVKEHLRGVRPTTAVHHVCRPHHASDIQKYTVPQYRPETSRPLFKNTLLLQGQRRLDRGDPPATVFVGLRSVSDALLTWYLSWRTRPGTLHLPVYEISAWSNCTGKPDVCRPPALPYRDWTTTFNRFDTWMLNSTTSIPFPLSFQNINQR